MFKKFIATAFIAVGAVSAAQAQWQPTKPVEAVIAFPPGSANDIIFRVLSKQVEINTGAKFVVINKPGAGGVVGTEDLAKRDADGYSVTMVSVPGVAAMDKVQVPNKGYTTDSFVYPMLAATTSFVVVSGPNDAVSTPAQLIAALKKEKLAISASGGARLVFEMLAQKTNFPQGKDGVVRVEHKGPVETLQDVSGGHVRFGIVPASVAYPFYQDKRVKVVAVSSRPLAQLSGVQPIASAIPGFDVPAAWGLMLPKGVSKDVQDWYAREFKKALAAGETKTMFENNLYQEDTALQNPQAFESYIKRVERQYQPLVDAVLASQKQ
jgi:tripartite-type tricarboxylate transporter receptor subunit TctC